MPRNKKSKRVRQASAVQTLEHAKKYAGGPSSFVVKLNSVNSPLLSELVLNVRSIMSPRTAMHLVEKKTNKLKDYTSVCGQLDVTHCLFFSQTLFNSVLRMAHFPQGPTLYFNIESYTLVKDIANSMTHPVSLGTSLSLSPLVIMGGFEESKNKPHVHLCASFLKNLFPPNPVKRTQLSEVKRVVLFHYDTKRDLVDVRQYKIQVKTPDSVNELILKADKHLSEIVEEGKDLAEYVLENITTSRELNKDDQAIAELKVSKRRKIKKKIQLVETGPRLSLTLFQVQEGFCTGNNIYVKDQRTIENLTDKGEKNNDSELSHSKDEENLKSSKSVTYQDR